MAKWLHIICYLFKRPRNRMHGRCKFSTASHINISKTNICLECERAKRIQRKKTELQKDVERAPQFCVIENSLLLFVSITFNGDELWWNHTSTHSSFAPHTSPPLRRKKIYKSALCVYGMNCEFKFRLCFRLIQCFAFGSVFTSGRKMSIQALTKERIFLFNCNVNQELFSVDWSFIICFAW